jgi:uncharacterized protein (TIGR02466 family)
MADVRHLFSTPFAIETVDDASLVAGLRDAIAAERTRDPGGITHSNLGGWHSNMEMLAWGGGPARDLARHAIGMAEALTIDRGSPDASRYRWTAEMWANVCTRGHANQFHVHPGSFWSAVYYLDDGYGGSDDPALGGELQLLDPRMPMVAMARPELAFREPDGTIQHAELTLRPRTGVMVTFPAWLQHGVRPYLGSGERISIAINLKPTRPEPASG